MRALAAVLLAMALACADPGAVADSCDEVDEFVRSLGSELASPVPRPEYGPGKAGAATELGITDRMAEHMNEAKEAADHRRLRDARGRDVAFRYASAVTDNPECFTVEERVEARQILDRLSP